MIELTEQQRHELRSTDVPQIIDPGTGIIYVLVQAEVYARLKELLSDEPKVTGEFVDRLMEEEDRDDPTLMPVSPACRPEDRALQAERNDNLASH